MFTRRILPQALVATGTLIPHKKHPPTRWQRQTYKLRNPVRADKASPIIGRCIETSMVANREVSSKLVAIQFGLPPLPLPDLAIILRLRGV
ncbi:MAG: hypothetical protein CME36_00495 [unclassified Hahellaceae]|nr:hypothetical protein [Hahellaceae bacterium]